MYYLNNCINFPNMKKLLATYPFLRRSYEDELLLVLYINCFGLLRCPPCTLNPHVQRQTQYFLTYISFLFPSLVFDTITYPETQTSNLVLT